MFFTLSFSSFLHFFRNLKALLMFKHVSIVYDDDFGLFQGTATIFFVIGTLKFVKVKINPIECDMLIRTVVVVNKPKRRETKKRQQPRTDNFRLYGMKKISTVLF